MPIKIINPKKPKAEPKKPLVQVMLWLMSLEKSELFWLLVSIIMVPLIIMLISKPLVIAILVIGMQIAYLVGYGILFQLIIKVFNIFFKK